MAIIKVLNKNAVVHLDRALHLVRPQILCDQPESSALTHLSISPVSSTTHMQLDTLVRHDSSGPSNRSMVQPSLNCTVPDTVHSKRDEHNGQQSCDNAQEPTPSMRAEAYPQSDSGTGAYCALIGSWFSLLPASGLLNSTGILQAYFAENQLKHFTESQISWIFSIFAFLFFFGGILMGPLYDKYRLWPMMPLGGYGLVLSLLMLSFCSSYYQFILRTLYTRWSFCFYSLELHSCHFESLVLPQAWYCRRTCNFCWWHRRNHHPNPVAEA